MENRVWILGCLSLAALFLPAHAAFAQEYPTRPITMVVPFPGGGGVDFIARLLVGGVSNTLGRPVVVENRAGAGGTIGANSVARAQPDGYTLLMTVNPPIVLNPFLQKDLPYDPRTAFEPVTLLAGTSVLLVAAPSLPVRNVAELVAFAKKNPGQVSYGTPGIGTGQHLVGELLKKYAGIDIVHVPYKGTGQMMQELLSGEIKLAWPSVPAALPLAQAGKIRVIGVADESRIPELPDVATVHETVPGVSVNAWYAVFAPRSTPRPIVDRLNAALIAELRNPDVVAKFKTAGVFVSPQGPEGLRKLVNTDLDRWGREIPAMGIKPE